MNRILIVKLSSLGDLFHALPAVRLIRQQTGAAVDWVCHDIYADLVRCFTDVDRVIPFPRSTYWRKRRMFREELRAREYDLVLDMQGLLKSAFLVARQARAKRRIGPSFSREGASLFYDAVAGPTNKDRHAVDENLDAVRFLGLATGTVEFPVRFPETPHRFPNPSVGLLPCSRQQRKNWLPDRFAAVARALREQEGATVVLLGGPSDAGVCAAIAAAAGAGVRNLCGCTSMVELGGVLKSLDLLVTVDSGPMHIAAAVGTPVVAIFGPTDPKRTGPYGGRARVVQMGADMRDTAVDDVVSAARAMLRPT